MEQGGAQQGGAEGAGVQPPVVVTPTFGGAPGGAAGPAAAGNDLDVLVGQLNMWLPSMNNEMATTKQQIAEMRGDMIMLHTKMDSTVTKNQQDLQQMADAGMTALMKTIEDFRIELNKHEHASNQLKAGLETVVVGAEAKFQDTTKMLEEFRNEFVRRSIADELLRAELHKLVEDVQNKFVDLDVKVAAAGAQQQQQQQQPQPRPQQPAAAAANLWDPWTGPADPWAAAADTTTATPAGTTAPTGTSAQTGSTPSTKAYSVTGKWGTHKHLDLLVTPEAYMAWRDRALGFLSKDRQDVRRLLIWAEGHQGPIGPADEATGAGSVGLSLQQQETAGDVCHALFEGIKDIINDTLLSRARACGDGRGLELWRKLKSEWEGTAPQVIAAKARRFNDPIRCATALSLWDELPKWEQLGVEVAAGGCQAPDMLKAIALDKLVPEDLLKQIVGRQDLAPFEAKLTWVKAQMEYVKGSSRALQVQQQPSTASRKKADDDVDMGNLQQEGIGAGTGTRTPPATAPDDIILLHLNDVCAEKAKNGDYEGVSVLANMIHNFKGKGKGKSRGNSWNPGKGGGYGGGGFGGGGYGGGQGGFPSQGRDPAKGKGKFDGNCNHCGKWSHKKAQCRTLDAEMQGNGKGKGLNYTGNEEENGEEEQGADQKGEIDEASRWWLGLGHLKREAPSVEIKNRFAAFGEGGEEEDTRAQVAPPLCHSEPAIDQDEPTMFWQSVDALEKIKEQRKEDMKQNGHDGFEPKTKVSWNQQRRARKKYECGLCIMTRADMAKGEEDKSVNALGKKTPGAVLVEAVVDSGAVDSVTPPKIFHAPVKPSEMSKSGTKYEGPDKSKIPNLGETDAVFAVDEGHSCGLRMQVADIARPLIAASHLADGGNIVQLGKKGGTIIHEKTGRKIAVQRRGGIYLLRMWISPPKDEAAASVFPRLGSKA